MMTRGEGLDDVVGICRCLLERLARGTGLMAIVVKKASPLTYKRPGTLGTAAGTRRSFIDSVLNRLKRL